MHRIESSPATPTSHAPPAWSPLELTRAQLEAERPGTAIGSLDHLIERSHPAIIVRGAYPADWCGEVVDRVLPAALESSSPDHVRLGPVFGWLKHVPATYLRLAELVAPLFASLFEELPSPIDALYATLAQLAAGRRVATAMEPDGRSYAPAVFRAFPAGTGHHPHVDSVEAFRAHHPWRVADYRWQLSVVLCLQNAAEQVRPVIYDQLATPEVLRHLDAGTFHGFADQHAVRRAAIELAPGDLYVFWAANVHEVPLVRGEGHRVLLAAFAGMDPHRDDVVVWA